MPGDGWRPPHDGAGDPFAPRASSDPGPGSHDDYWGDPAFGRDPVDDPPPWGRRDPARGPADWGPPRAPVWGDPGRAGSTWNPGIGPASRQQPEYHPPDLGFPPDRREPGDERRRTARRRSLGALAGPLAGAIGLAILLGAGVYALADRGCGGGGIALNVSVAPDIAPAVRHITEAFNGDRHTVDGRCVNAVVRASDPAGMSTLLSGQGTLPGETTPDVWIPDSSMWVTLVRSTPAGASSVSTTPTTVARTPVVVATSRAFHARIQSQGIRPTWDMLLKATDALAAGAVSKNDMLPADSVHLQILDPTRNAGGLSAVVMTRMLLQGDPNANMIFTQIVRKTQTSVSPTTQALFATFRQDLHGRAPVVIAPEQAVWRYNQTHPPVPASAIYPSEGMLSLDYPYTLTTHDDRKVRASAMLERAMSTQRAADEVHALGFRTPDGHLGKILAAGLSPRLPRALPSPAATDVTDVMEAWTKLSLRTRMLTLIDVSGSMGVPVGKGVSRLQATAQVAQAGLGLLPDDTDLGLWTFSTNLQGAQDYRADVPIGSLSSRLGRVTRRQAIIDALGRLRPKPNGDTGLYDSVLAAYRSMQSSYRAGFYNTVLVLTDGRNDNPGGVSLGRLLGALKKENDPAKPVMIVFIGFGPDVDMGAMQRIAAQTNGVAYHTTRPQEIQRIFLDTIARRICAPECH
jgi:hypothetical protein